MTSAPARYGEVLNRDIRGDEWFRRQAVLNAATEPEQLSRAVEHLQAAVCRAGRAKRASATDLAAIRDLTNWPIGPTLGLIYGSVVLLFITPAATNDPPPRFYRATGVP